MSAVKKEESESDDESTVVESDLNTTVIPQDSDPVGPLPLRTPVGASPSKPPAKLTYGVSPTLDGETKTVDLFLTENIKGEDPPDYTHGDLYLPIPGTPSINDLEPEETPQLTARGNRAKIVVIKLWKSRYQTERFMVDDLTGEIYAIKEKGIDVIKEQAFLDRKLAWEAVIVDFPELSTPLAEKKEPPDKTGRLNKNGMSGAPPSENLEQKALRYQEFRETLQRYQSTRRQRRKLEGELLFYELPGKEPGITTDQEAERERMMVLVQQKKILDQEIPLLKKCMELAPENPETEEDHLSELSLDHYECEKDWMEPTYRKLLFLYEKRNKKASLLSHLRDVKARRYPHRSSDFNKELFEAREKWTKGQKEGNAMLKIAKMEVDFKRKRHNLVCQAVQEERRKWEEQRVSWDKQKEEEFEERRRNWAELTAKELVRQQQIFNEEKEKLQGRMQTRENQFKEELDKKAARELELMENFKQQQRRT